jgi:hypothetical protein
MQAMTPFSVLCPSTPFFFLYLVSFVFGIFKFNSLHTEDLDLADGYSFFIIAGLLSLDWQNVLVSLQVIMAIMIWNATVLQPIAHWFFKTFFPGVIREIQGGEEVAGGGVEENNGGWRREGGRC